MYQAADIGRHGNSVQPQSNRNARNRLISTKNFDHAWNTPLFHRRFAVARGESRETDGIRCQHQLWKNSTTTPPSILAVTLLYFRHGGNVVTSTASAMTRSACRPESTILNAGRCRDDQMVFFDWNGHVDSDGNWLCGRRRYPERCAGDPWAGSVKTEKI